jgi:hypothetical protein
MLLIPVLLFGQGYLDLQFVQYQINDSRSISMGRTWNTASDNYFPQLRTSWAFKVHDRLILLGPIEDELTENNYRDNFNADYSSDYSLHKKFPEFSLRSPAFDLNENIDFAFGLEYATPIDVGLNIGSEIKFPDGTTEIDDMWRGGLSTITPSVAFSYNNQFSVGFHYYIPVSFDIETESEFKDNGFSSRNVSEWSLAGGSFFMVDAFGQFGDLRAGASFQSAFEPDKDSFSSKIYQNGVLVNESKSDGSSLSYPSSFQVGLEYQVTDKLSIAADYQTRNYEDIKIDDVDLFDVKNGFKIGLGAEYDWCENFDVRLGFAFDTVPVSDFDDDKPNRLISLGGGVRTDLNEYLNFNQVENIYFDGFLIGDSWSAKTSEDTEYKELRVTIGSSISVSF